jgi:hypothetical protein
VIQLTLLEPDQGQPVGALTLVAPDPPVAATDSVLVERVKVHPTPDWVTVNV